MKKTIYIILSIVFLLAAKVTYSQLNMRIIVSGGVSFPSADFKQDVPIVDTVREDWPYQLKIGYNLSAIGVLPLNKQKNINLTFGLTYTSLSNNVGVIAPVAGGGNRDNNGLGTGSDVTFMPKIALYTLNLGGVYIFNIKKQFKQMLSMDITGNFFTGNFDFDITNTGTYTPTDLKSTLRFGLQFGGALEYQINDNYGIYLGTKYNLANLVGRTADVSTQTISIALGDKEHSENGIVRPSKTISYFQLSAGVVLYLNDNPEQKK